MGLIFQAVITDDSINPDARQVLMSTELATSMDAGMLVREVWGVFQRITDASPNLGGGPVLDGQRELEAPPPLAEVVEESEG